MARSFFRNLGIFSTYITFFKLKVISILLVKKTSRFLKCNYIIHQEQFLRYKGIVNEVKIFVLELSVSVHPRILFLFVLQLQVQSCSLFNCWISTADLLSLVLFWVLKLQRTSLWYESFEDTQNIRWASLETLIPTPSSSTSSRSVRKGG